MKIDIRGLADTRRAVGELAKQIPFATAKAINTTAFAVRAAEQKELQAKLDRPTPWLPKQVWVKQATKTSLAAKVGSKSGVDGTAAVLDRVVAPHIVGGSRLPKPVEDQIRRKNWMPASWRAIPTPSETRDQYGNLPLADWMRLIAMTNPNYFVVPVGSAKARHLAPGIYRRYGAAQHGYTGRRVERLLAFVADTRYRSRVDWSGVGERTVTETFPGAFDAALTDAINSAR